MNNSTDTHTFHIPVMGIGFTVDTPVKVAQYGVSSVISLLDDILIEKMREFYSKKFDLPFQAITNKMDDFRARRITAYLNLMNDIVNEKFEEVKNSVSENSGELEKYMDMLPDFSGLKQKFKSFSDNDNISALSSWVKENLTLGSVDVNIMTKVDRDLFDGDTKLPPERYDAHAALRGFANSNLESSLVLSAGMNPRLYSYLEKFDDFFPDAMGKLKKKVILKVSDYRSALIQAKFLAKKGIWVSEFRVESGLNCGGHAFASEGHLLGPVLEEFKQKRAELVQQAHEIYTRALSKKDRIVPEMPLQIRITAQGGVGTAKEHQFLLDYYKLDSVGWGTPFLLAPEIVNVDETTLKLLVDAKEDDLYLSDISPLGVKFNNLRTNTRDIEKREQIATGRPGSSCPKHYARLDKEYTEKGMCTASRQYQKIKLNEIKALGLPEKEYQQRYEKVVDKSCICVGLGTGALLINDLDHRVEGNGVSICPGPNMAYFTEVTNLKGMIDHIYGRLNLIKRNDRPNMFIKELKLYIDYLKDQINEVESDDKSSFLTFQDNLHNSIDYYKNLFAEFKTKMEDKQNTFSTDLDNLKQELIKVKQTIIGE